MRNNWKKCKLGTFCPFEYGKGLLQKDRKKGAVPIYGSNGINGWNYKAYVSTPGIIVGRKGTAGSVTLSQTAFWPIDTTFFIKDEPQKRNLRFTYYLLKNINFKNLISDSAVPGLNRDMAHSIEILVPDMEEQKRIADILGAFDDKIELLQKQNTTLENMAKALFKSWFVDFGIVHAKQQGQPKAAVMQQYHLTEELYNLFPSSFEPSALGPIPTGWQVKSLDDLANLVLGGTPSRVKKSYWDNGTIPWINSGKINDFRIATASEYITQNGYDHSATKMMPKRTTLVAITGATLGAVSLTEIECCANQSVVGIVATQKLPSEYVYPWILFNMDALLAKQTGGAQQHINKNDVASLLVLLPSSSILKSYVESVANLYNKITCNVKQIQTLTEMRDALLPRLISGKIRV